MKLVINKCYGGYSLSMKAVKRLAELQGRKVWFFMQDYKDGLDGPFIPVKKGARFLSWWAFDVKDPNKLFKTRGKKKWNELTADERMADNKVFTDHTIDSRPGNRADPLLVQVVEELGEDADGECAKLEVIEIPDGVDYDIEDYDGMESIHERHRSWG